MELQKGILYPGDDVVVVGEVCLARLAPVDLVRIEVDVVLESHGRYKVAGKERPSFGCGERSVLTSGYWSCGTEA